MNESIPIHKWGKDHWSTLAYLEVRCVDHKGIPNRGHMRCNPEIHPGLCNTANSQEFGGDTKERYPTRLAGGVEQPNHDDWSCVDDMEAAGLLKNEGSGTNPIISLTDYGMIVCNALRNHKASGGSFGNFTFKPLVLQSG